MYKIGNGYDIHRLIEGRKLILGGIEINYEKGLLGHSDADVLIHSMMDAMLGALALGDIGQHFPDTDPMYKGISSVLLLEKENELVLSKGYKISNTDNIILAEKPKMKDIIPLMRENLSKILKIPQDSISIKATTMEKLGPIGEGQAIAVQSVVLLEKISPTGKCSSNFDAED